MTNEFDINKVTAELITDLAKTTGKKLFDKLKTIFKDLHNEDQVDFRYAFEDYLKYTKGVHSRIKTLLYRHTPKDIYSFYECIGLSHGKEVIKTSNVNNIIKIGHRIIVTGTGGIGKSIMMKHLFLNAIENTDFIPIIIELRGLNDLNENDIDMSEYLFKVMKNFKFKLEKRYFTYSLEMGCYLILLDGFDEVKNTLSQKATKAIFDLCDKYPDNYYIISSRQLEEFVGWNQFIELQSRPLNKKQALSLISKLDYDESIKNKFYNELNDRLYNNYKTFASNPLLLTIMLLTFENRISIPDKLNDFYEQAFTTLFHAHDATKGYKRDNLCGLGYEDFKSIFAYFCFKSFFKSEYKFTESKILDYISLAKERKIIDVDFDSLNYLKDLTNSVCMLIHEGLEYRFTHRSFQEYFAALYTIQLDDNQQKRFLSAWLKESSHRVTTNYLEMLYELQPSRFVKNILYPGFMELIDMYEENDYKKEWLLKTLYSHIEIFEIDDNKKCYLCVKSSYFCEIISQTCNIGNFYEIQKAHKHKEEIYNKKNDSLVKLIENHYNLGESLTFETLKEDGLLDNVIDKLEWIFDGFEFTKEYLNNYDCLQIGRKKKFSSMLDEL